MSAPRMTKQHCAGCHSDFYNGHNDLGVTECWSFKDAKLVLRKEIPVDQRPPWTQDAQLLPNCYSRPRYVYVKPEQIR